MKIIIIEDELKAAKSLASLINKIRPKAQVVANLQSIDDAIHYFTENEHPDLIFMDIQLSDGLSFEIFQSVKISCPVIFCTAYGEYAMDAIKANGIDYLLKPFSQEDLEKAFEKVDQFQNFFQQNQLPDMDELLKRIGPNESKKSFLVFKHNKYTTVPTEQIAFFYIRNESPTIMTLKEEEYTLNQSMDTIQGQLSALQFFRLNRQYIVNFSAIKEVEHYFDRKLFVKLVIPSPEKLLIGKEKTTAFLNWLENR
ncbi:LytR/AlgR family response regulator transcription factor [Pedobacter soli]|uniref:Two component transcriptional regulator, LytTR family n=1 Tax=Pedobacter soli TaxID=390242 RepID=A0A1G6JF33_9SPHI|nr:LytTR family DNA-binding domain-containing protein [Pedobacter soli]SDC17341.1 two component transcriptional regulator, LytTR family [Pedobacter soli]